jgi:hypothetical protein
LDTSDTGPHPPAQVQLALPDWSPDGDLMPLEEEMLVKAAVGELVDPGAGPFDVAAMRVWGEERAVRARVLRHLLVERQWPVHAKGVRLRGVRISGHLDVEGATLHCPLSLESCYLDAGEPVCLDHATVSRLTMTRCQLAGLTGEMLTARELDLSHSTLTGPLRLPGADITGQLRCSGARLSGADQHRDALVGDGIKVGGGVFLDDGFTATAGAVGLPGADITSQLRCRGARLTAASLTGYALAAERIKVGGNVYLDGTFTAAGAVQLSGADISGQLSCSGAQLGADQDRCALAAERIKVGGNVYLDGKFTAAGAVRLYGAEITGQLSCSGAKLTGRDNDGYVLVGSKMKAGGNVGLDSVSTVGGAVRLVGAEITGQFSCRGAHLTGSDSDGDVLWADGLKVGASVFLDGEFTAAGGVQLVGAEITGQFSCRGAHLAGNHSGDALAAFGMKAGAGVFLDGGFTAAGAVRLSGAQITDQFSCRDACLSGSHSGDALAADGMNVGGDVLLDGKFAADGTVSLVSAHVDGSVYLVPDRLAGDETAVAFDAGQAHITGKLKWVPAEPVRGQVSLEDATVGELEDHWSDERTNGYWPMGGRLDLSGFTYTGFGGHHQANVQQRLAWIRSQYSPKPPVPWTPTLAPPVTTPGRDSAAGFASKPYEQLADVYRQAGQDTEARKVAIAMRADLRRYGNLNWYRTAGNWLLDKTIKYGYQAWRAGVALAAVFAAFWVLSVFAQHHHLMVPVGSFTGSAPSAAQCTTSYPCFYPAGYAIDTVIPLINVHQAAYWGPDGNAPWGWAWVAGTWIATGLGWALATLLVAGYTGLVRQD